MIELGGRLFNVIETRKDGSCLFEALSHGLVHSDALRFELRQQLVEVVCQDWGRLQPETDRGGFQPYETAAEYRRYMLRHGTYGGSAEIYACAYVNHVTIHVYQGTILMDTYNPGCVDQMSLLYDPALQHYRYLNPAQVTDDVSEDGLNDSSVPDMESSDEDTQPMSLASDGEEPDMFAGEYPDGHRIGAYERRPYDRPENIPGLATSKQSLCLPFGRVVGTYMWAGLYAGESLSAVEEVNLGEFDAECPNPNCEAIFWEAEQLCNKAGVPYWCCGKKRRNRLTELGVFQEIRDERIKDLYFGDSEVSVHFRRHIRAYNSALSTAMPRVNYQKDSRTNKALKVNGKVLFKAAANPNFDSECIPRNHGQLYFLDMDHDTVERRVSASTDPHVRPDIVAMLETYLRSHNHFVRTFELASAILAEQEGVTGFASDELMLLVNPHRQGFRRTDRALFAEDDGLQRPTDSETVAAVYVGARPPYSYDMVFRPRNRSDDDPPYVEVNESSPTLDLMLYPLIHLHAEDAWVEPDPVIPGRSDSDADLKDNCGTIRQYYSSRLMIRDESRHGVLFRARGLFQQWLCDAALKITEARLRYAEKNQDELQVCHYDSLQQFVANHAAQMGKKPGRVVIIPRNEQKSERKMYGHYLDAVRIAIEFGGPVLFLTFSCNPRWREILRLLRKRGLSDDEYQQAPDVVVRVFIARLGIFLSDVVNKGVFGRVAAFVGVHEFTTSLLPHFHLAVILHPVDIPSTPSDIDAIISAEIPSEENPKLRKLVLNLMTHRPCDGTSPGYTPYCLDASGRCKHGFPQQFQEATVVGLKSGPKYRRRENAGVWHPKYKCMIDNRWVVPYNALMLLRHLNHLNILVCSEDTPFKYLFGYMEKEENGQHVQGSMMRHFREQDGDDMHWDEIEHYRAMRSIGCYESVYRIFGIPLSTMSHSVLTLPVHLPSKQYVYYKGPASVAADLEEHSQLLAWFELNKTDEGARELLYSDLVGRYRYDTVHHKWVKKRVSTTLGRLMPVNPSVGNTELFHLRILLLNRRGMTGWPDMLTDEEGVQHGTFLETCTALGLVTSTGTAYSEAMEEVVTHASSWQIRHFFAVLICHCLLDDVNTMWLKHRGDMAKDMVRRGVGTSTALNRVRNHIVELVRTMADQMIERVSRLLTLPVMRDGVAAEEVPVSVDESDVCNDDVDAQPPSAEMDSVDAYISTYNAEQAIVHRSVMDLVERNDTTVSNILSLIAPAGSGKTYVYTGLIMDCKRRGFGVTVTAFTAIAAVLLLDGETCHKTFGISVRARCDSTDRSYYEANSPEAEKLLSSRLILIDEASMLSQWQVNLIDEFLKMITGNNTVPFGGKIVLFGGDMGQILPVVRNGTAAEIEANSLPSWPLWRTRTEFSLTQNVRAAEDPEFATWLSEVRDGRANLPGTDDIIVPDSMLVKGTPLDPRGYKTSEHGNEADELPLVHAMIDNVYGDLSHGMMESGIILSPTNSVVRRINSVVLGRIAGRTKVYYACSKMISEDAPGAENPGFIMTREEVERIHAPNIPPHALCLKIGAVVMLLLNLNKKQGLCNGTRFIVTGMYNDCIKVRRLVAFRGRKDEVFLPKLKMRSDDVPLAGTIERHQIPVTLAFAITVNKSQGQSFDRVGVFLRRPVFTHGQFYVAAGRCRRRKNLWFAIVRGRDQGPIGAFRRHRRGRNNTKTRNIVFRHLLA